jgi:hypothetical protein
MKFYFRIKGTTSVPVFSTVTINGTEKGIKLLTFIKVVTPFAKRR